MDFGLSLVTQYEPSRDLTGIAGELVDQIDRAADGGFDFVRVAEHHVTDDHYLLNEAVTSYIARDIGDMTLDMMCLLPYHNPVRIAEYAATVDVLTEGQFRLTVAQGYRPEEFAVFGVEDRGDAIGRLVEGIEVIKRLWTTADVDYDGQFFQLDGVSINPRPIQEPRPSIFAGASNETSIRRAARLVDGWVGAHVPFDVVGDQVAAFRDECAASGQGAKPVGFGREVCVADTTEEAEASVREPLMRKYERYVEWGQDDAIADDEFHAEWEDLKRDRFVIGTPDEVIAEIRRYQDAFDLDFLGLRTQFKGMEFDAVRRSQSLLGEEVLPALNEPG